MYGRVGAQVAPDANESHTAFAAGGAGSLQSVSSAHYQQALQDQQMGMGMGMGMQMGMGMGMQGEQTSR